MLSMTKPNLPSQWMDELLAGRADLSDTPAAVQSWFRFALYKMASDIVKLPDQAARRHALAKLNDKMLPLVEAEVRRIWAWRDDL